MRQALLTISLAITCIAANALTLDGKCQVVIPENANVQEKYAAGELGKYLGSVLGTEIKQITEDKFAGDQAIYIGNTKLAQAENFEPFANEEYAMKSKDGNVILTGAKFRGVLYGTYDFLERFAGVRFFTPNCERVPKKSNIDVPDDLSIRRKPAFEFRHIYTGEGHRGIPMAFRPKYRCNVSVGKPELGGSDSYGTGGACHTYYRYSKDFPKEISWMNGNGERTIVTTAGLGSICFSHPEVLKRFTARLKELIATDRKDYTEQGLPAPRFYVVQQNDCNATCYCPECQAFKKKHGLSGLVIDFSNRLADSIKDEYPDVCIIIFAYFDTLEPPTSDIRPRSNVFPQITTYTQSYHDHLRAIDDPVNAKAAALLDRWAAISDNLAIWDYWRYFSGFLVPATPVKNIQGLTKKYRDCKIRFFFTEYEISNKTILSFFDLTCYVGYRMLDNPDLDADLLIDEFMEGYYGAAAPYMRNYLDLLTEKFKMCGNVVEECVAYNKRKYVNDTEFYQEGLNLLTQAEDAIENSENASEIRKRIHAETLLHLSTYLKVYLRYNADKPLSVGSVQFTEDYSKKYIETIVPDVATTLLHQYERTEKKLVEMKKHYTAQNKMKPTQGIVPKPLATLPEGTKVYESDEFASSGVKINDADAPKGSAYSLAAKYSKEDNEKKHDRPFTFGIYEKTEEHYVAISTFSAADIPQDEQYHWYYAGRTFLTPRTIAYIHWTWVLNSALGIFYDENNPDQVYDVYLNLKLQGPAYVKGSTSQNDVRIAGTALLKVNNE